MPVRWGNPDDFCRSDTAMRTHAYMRVALLLIVTVTGLAVAAEPLRLPDLGRTSTQVLSPAEASSFPHRFRQVMRANDLLMEDPLIADFFSDMGFRLVSNSEKPDEPFHFFVLRDPTINAFAMPAGVVALHSELILAAQNESEVAGVLAHEIAHVTQDHIARGAEAAKEASFPAMIAALGLAIAAGMAGVEGDAAQAILFGGMGLAQQMQISHTRQSEAEADRIGISLLARSGYEPEGMTRFFQHLNRISRVMGEGPPEYLRTHPLTVNRIAEARSRAGEFEVKSPRDGEEFQFVQARLRAQLVEPSQAQRWFEARLNGQEGRPEQAMHYGLALSLIEGRRLAQARAEVDWLLARQPDRQLYQLLEAQLLLAENRVDESVQRLAELNAQYPGSRMVVTQYAQTLMHERDRDRAQIAADLLRQYLRNYPEDVSMLELYARAADRAGDEVRAAEALAESYYLRGGLLEAIVQLELAVERTDLNYYQRARIEARLNEMRAERLRLTSRQRHEQS